MFTPKIIDFSEYFYPEMSYHKMKESVQALKELSGKYNLIIITQNQHYNENGHLKYDMHPWNLAAILIKAESSYYSENVEFKILKNRWE